MLALASVALIACGGDDGGQTSAQIWCDGVCVAVQRCGYQCRPDCVAERPGLANYSPGGAAAEKPCLESLSCGAISGNEAAWDAELDACWEQAKLSVVATPHARQFCQSHALRWFDCGYDLPIDECERRYAMWSDAILDQLARCETKPSCEEFSACATGVFAAL